MRINGKSVAVGISFCLIAASILLFIRRDSLAGIADAYSLLSDLCFTVGVMLVGMGGLNYASDCGLFDPFYYTFYKISSDGAMNYGDYKASRRENKKESAPMMVTGAGFILASVVFCVLYLV